MREIDWYILDSLMRTKNITKSAEALYMSQPTITKRIMNIEEHFGVKLLKRTNKGVTFTPEGECLGQRAAGLAASFKQINEEMERFSSGKFGEIRLVMPNSFGKFRFPHIIRNYSALCPGVSFSVQTALSDKVCGVMEAGEASVGFICGDYVFAGEKYDIYEEQSFLAYARKVTLGEIPALPRIEYVKGVFTKKLLDGWIAENFPSKLRVSFSVDNGDTALEMVRSGLGYSFFSAEKFLENDKALFRLPLYNKDGSPLVRKTWMLWYKDDYERSMIIKNFVDFMRSEQ